MSRQYPKSSSNAWECVLWLCFPDGMITSPQARNVVTCGGLTKSTFKKLDRSNMSSDNFGSSPPERSWSKLTSSICAFRLPACLLRFGVSGSDARRHGWGQRWLLSIHWINIRLLTKTLLRLIWRWCTVIACSACCLCLLGCAAGAGAAAAAVNASAVACCKISDMSTIRSPLLLI